jgi:predicted amidohydrolase
MDNCRIVLAQTNPRLGDVSGNLEDHLTRIGAAASSGAALIVFPELSLTGYFLKDQVHELALERDAGVLGELAEASRGISIVAGFVERDPAGRIYNALGFFEDGELKGVHRKVHLVSYGMFDEGRDFAAGEAFAAFESRHGRFGPLICEDLWHAPSAYLHFLDDVDVLLVSSASPARGVEAPGPGLASQRTWDTLLRAHALLYRTWVVYVGRVGWEDGIGFGGSSMVLDPCANEVVRMDALEPGEVEAELTSDVLHRARMETPLRRDEKPWLLAAELARHVPSLRGEPTDTPAGEE